MELDRKSGVPLYRQIKTQLIEMINHQYEPGDLLPSEPELEKLFGVSRTTIRLSVDALLQDDLVEKQQGRGTFIKNTKTKKDLMQITSWTEEMIKKGHIPSTKNLEMKRIRPNKKLMGILNLTELDTVIWVRRVRYADGEPMCIMTNYFVESYIPGFLDKALENESIYQIISESYKLNFKYKKETISAREATKDEALELKVKTYSPVLVGNAVTYINENEPFEYAYIVSRADRYEYENNIYNK